MGRASHSLPLSEADGGWYHLLPAGEFTGRDGRGPYRNTDPAAILAAFEGWGMPLTVDYDHQTETASEKTGPVPAAGWGKALEVRAGALWAQIDWTDTAATAIGRREYMYLSPVFEFDQKTGVVTRLVSAAITNLPNLELAPLTQHRQGGSMMDDLISQLRYLLNLPVTVTPEEIAAHLQTLVDRLRGTEADIAEMAQLLGESEQTQEPRAVLRAASARLAGAVEKTEHERVLAELAGLRQEHRAMEVDAFLREAMSQRRIAPAQEAAVREYAAQDLDGCKRFVAALPEIVPAGGLVPSGPPGQTARTAQSVRVPSGYGADPDGLARHERILAHQKQHGGSYLDAARTLDRS
jgi:phage I-like protein